MIRKICRKNYKNILRSNNYEGCTAVASCVPNILDVMVLENMNLYYDRIGGPPLWSNKKKDLDFCHQSATWGVRGVYFKRTLISYVHGLRSV
jgi:hypothetical protein